MKTRVLDPDGTWTHVWPADGEEPLNAQEWFVARAREQAVDESEQPEARLLPAARQGRGRAAWQGDDADRPLTAGGRGGDAARGEAAARPGLAPDVIVTSPLVRARRTAEIVAEALGLGGRLVEDDRLAPGFDVRRLGSCSRRTARRGAVMVVGHEPDFSATVAELIGGGEVVMKKGGLARVDVHRARVRRRRLAWLLTPPLLGSR